MQSNFRESYFHIPIPENAEFFIQIFRAGKIQAASDYKIERAFSPGHDILYCLKGEGFVTVRGRRFQVNSGELAWIDGGEPHSHFANSKTPWELMWLRATGTALDHLARKLQVTVRPVFQALNASPCHEIFKSILGLMNTRPLSMEALLNLELWRLLTVLFEVRQKTTKSPENPQISPPIARTLERMSIYYYRTWRIHELAHFCRMSPSHFHRCFRTATGTSPVEWLRRERINHAKRELLETNRAIKQIAEKVGYHCPYFFSRDFKKYSGAAPSVYRLQEKARTTPQNL